MTNEIPIDLFKHEHAYTLIFIHKKTNEVICESCARKLNVCEHDNYVYTTFLEGDTLQCDECHEIIESDYGPIE